jgi:hypothetical protein
MIPYVFHSKWRMWYMEKKLGAVLVKTYLGDITELAVDAIANAANSDLWMGSGVAGAIKSKGGHQIEKEAVSMGPIRPGEAVMTTAGDLPSKYVIHCAGMPPGGKATYWKVLASVQSGFCCVPGNWSGSWGLIGRTVCESNCRRYIPLCSDTKFSKGNNTSRFQQVCL